MAIAQSIVGRDALMKYLAAYHPAGSPRGRSVIQEFTQGVIQADTQHKVKIHNEQSYTRPLDVEAAVFYGLSGNLLQIFQDYRAAHYPTVFFDLPYWGRKREPSPQCHRFALNAYQPTAYFRQGHSPERFALFNRPIQPWRPPGKEILVIGMSEKQTQVWGLGDAFSYHSQLIDQVRAVTNRSIAWRPKPSCVVSNHAMPHTRFATGPLVVELKKAYCVVTYRSNVAIDGLIQGVPCIVLGDHPAEVMGRRSLADIDALYYPDDREAFCADLAWCQVTMRELRNGWAWKYIMSQLEHISACM